MYWFNYLKYFLWNNSCTYVHEPDSTSIFNSVLWTSVVILANNSTKVPQSSASNFPCVSVGEYVLLGTKHYNIQNNY